MSGRRTPKPAGVPAAEQVTDAAPIAGEVEPPASTPPSPVQKDGDDAELIPVRVISSSHGHTIDAVELIPRNLVEEATRLGWADPDPAAVAEATRLAGLDRLNQGFNRGVELKL